MTTDAMVAGGIVTVALGAFQLVRYVIARQANGKKTSVNPPRVDHGPCNDAVDRLSTIIEKDVDEQREFRLAFERWMAREEGRRDGLRQTGEHQIPT